MLTDLEMLKIELLTYGMDVSKSAKEAIEGNEKRPMTLSDYASTSGISMKLEDNTFVNAPIRKYNPSFVKENTPYLLDFKDGNFVVVSPNLEVIANPIPVPAYYNKTNGNNAKYTSFGITHTDRVRVSPINDGCAYKCGFCDLSAMGNYKTHSKEDLVGMLNVAIKDKINPAKHILISGGTPKPKDYAYLNDVYAAVAKSFPHHEVDIMMAPIPGLLDAKKLKDMGIHGLSINMEMYNERIARKVMPQKHNLSRQRYLDFIEEAVPIFGEGNVRSLLVVGIEPIEDTLKGVEALAERGCDPVLSPFRPASNTLLSNVMPPTVEFLAELYEKSKEIVDKYPDVKLGPRCIPCMHNTLTFPDDSGKYYSH